MTSPELFHQYTIRSQEQSSNAPSATNDTPVVKDDHMSEFLDKLKKAVEESTEREVNKEDSIEETGSCSCLDDKRDTLDVSDQKGTINIDSPIGTQVHVEDVKSSKPENAITGQSNEVISTNDTGPLSSPAKSKVPAESTAEGNILTKESASGNVSLSPHIPSPRPPGVSEVASPETNNQPNTLTRPLRVGTRENPETASDEVLMKQDLSSIQQDLEQKPPGSQNVTSNQQPRTNHPPKLKPQSLISWGY